MKSYSKPIECWYTMETLAKQLSDLCRRIDSGELDEGANQEKLSLIRARMDVLIKWDSKNGYQTILRVKPSIKPTRRNIR